MYRFCNLIRQYLWNWLVLSSQAFSVLLGGHPDESLSQRVGRARLAKPENLTFKILEDTINFVFRLLGEEDHVAKSLDGEPGAKTIWDWSK